MARGKKSSGGAVCNLADGQGATLAAYRQEANDPDDMSVWRDAVRIARIAK